ncbi:MAG: hypothetical protein ACRDJ4_12985, partial [Actinomycetota bacterium]
MEPPPSIAGNCSRDVTADLLSWISSVPNGSVLSFARGACYRIDGSLKLLDRRDLTFEGNGATFEAVSEADYGRRHWWLYGGGK